MAVQPSSPRPRLEAEGRGRVRTRTRSVRKVHLSDFNVHVLTWNVAGFMPSSAEVESLFLPQDGFMEAADLYKNMDVLVVGLQEAYQSPGDTFTSSLPLVGRDPHVEVFSSLLAERGFARLSSCRLWGILTMVFVKHPLLCYIQSVSSCATKTGFGGWVGNKGATSIRFTLGDMALCFTNCHLAPHPENNERRVMELKDIFNTQVFESSQLTLVNLLDHDVMVLFGDLNFRLEEKEFEEVCGLLGQGRQRELFRLDQLRIEQVRGEDSDSKLCYFMEMPIDFQPSYKYVPGSDDFSAGGKRRVPAWCDRVLWRMHERRLPKMTDSEPRNIVHQDYYCLHMQPRLSDHKAVSAGLRVLVDISSYCPAIVFELSEWVCSTSGTITIMVAAETEISMWDWVGLYPEHFASLDRDAFMWVWSPASRGKATHEKLYSRSVSPNQIPANPGRYILVYKSYLSNRVLGMSPIFRIQTSKS